MTARAGRRTEGCSTSALLKEERLHRGLIEVAPIALFLYAPQATALRALLREYGGYEFHVGLVRLIYHADPAGMLFRGASGVLHRFQ